MSDDNNQAEVHMGVSDMLQLWKEKCAHGRYPSPAHNRHEPQAEPEPVTDGPDLGHIGIVVIATNQYVDFLTGFIQSAEHFLLPRWHKHYLILSDRTDFELHKNAVHIPIAPLRWPDVVNLRYRTILGIDKAILTSFDYLFNFDVDLLFKNPIHDHEILSGLVGVASPLNINRDPRDLPFFERRPESACYIPVEKSRTSYSASITGGKPDYFVSTIGAAQALIDKDLAAGIQPVGYEESALNRVFLDTPPTLTLTPDFLWLEGTRLEPEYLTPRIISRNKPGLDAAKVGAVSGELLKHQNEYPAEPERREDGLHMPNGAILP